VLAILDLNYIEHYYSMMSGSRCDMTKLLEEAVATARRLPAEMQDDIARAILAPAGEEGGEVYILTPEEEAAIAVSKAAAKRGEFATDEEVRAVWAKFGL